VKGLTSQEADAKYYYVLKAQISKEPITAAIQNLQTTIALFAIGVVLLSLALANFFAKRLLSNLTLFGKKLESYLAGKIQAQEVALKSTDEIGFISKTFVEMLKKLETMTQLMVDTEKVRINAEKAAQLAQLASQVSHDIRSPLSALNLVVSSARTLPENERLLIRNATQRINDIANSLLHKSRANAEAKPSLAEPVLLVSLLDKVISEKRVQYRDRLGLDILGDLENGYGIFVIVDSAEFSRVISNLIKNSVDAIADTGKITVRLLSLSNHQAAITIDDTGHGIPEEIKERLGIRGATFGKAEGFGLGLSHAKLTVEAVGGSLTILSTSPKGTTIQLNLPTTQPPWWFIDRIVIGNSKRIVSVDDDQTIHQVWADRLQSAQHKLEHVMFTSVDKFSEWFEDDKNRNNNLYLIDYEYLDQRTNGLDLIEKLDIARDSILITSRHDEPRVRQQAKLLGVKIIPKVLATIVPIEF
jgi:signal transduction histidine kinase